VSYIPKVTQEPVTPKAMACDVAMQYWMERIVKVSTEDDTPTATNDTYELFEVDEINFDKDPYLGLKYIQLKVYCAGVK